MKLLLSREIRGYQNRGKENESSVIYASKGNIVRVILNNTHLDEGGNLTGHYICTLMNEDTFTIIDEKLTFIVFPSQVLTTLHKKERETEITRTLTKLQ